MAYSRKRFLEIRCMKVSELIELMVSEMIRSGGNASAEACWAADRLDELLPTPPDIAAVAELKALEE